MRLGIDGVNAIFREHAFRPITGDALLIGRQSLGIARNDVSELAREHRVPWPDPGKAAPPASNASARSTTETMELGCDEFFRMLGVANLTVFDDDPKTGATVAQRLGGAPGIQAVACTDFILDVGAIVDSFDPAAALRNLAGMLRPGGRLITINALTNDAGPYTVPSLTWYLDYFVMNNFRDCKAYTLVYFPDGTTNAFAIDLGHLAEGRPARNFASRHHMEALVFAEKGPDSTTQILPSRVSARTDAETRMYRDNLRRVMLSARPHLARSRGGLSCFDVLEEHLFVRPDSTAGDHAQARQRRPGNEVPHIVQGLLELRSPPPHLFDRQQSDRIRGIIAAALEAGARKDSRGANQIIIDQCGLTVRFERDEAYCAEALEYHVGLLYALIGEPERAAHHIGRSGTYPGQGGEQVFPEHQNEALELRRRQMLARERSMPAIMLSTMPRSGSASLTQTLATLLCIPSMRISCGRFPNYYLMPRWLNAFASGGAILHDHFGALPFNVAVLRAAGFDEVFVRTRDPRAAVVSVVRLGQKFGQVTDLETRVVEVYERSYVPWLEGWLAAACDPKSALTIHWLTHKASKTLDAARHVLSVLGRRHPALAEQARGTISETRENFVIGDDEAWRTSLSARTQERLWAATPLAVRDLLHLRA